MGPLNRSQRTGLYQQLGIDAHTSRYDCNSAFWEKEANLVAKRERCQTANYKIDKVARDYELASQLHYFYIEASRSPLAGSMIAITPPASPDCFSLSLLLSTELFVSTRNSQET